MYTRENEESAIISFVIWLVWVVIVIGVLSSTIYLFVGGSVLFSRSVSGPIVLYREVRGENISLSGSIMKPSGCHALAVSANGDKDMQNIALTFREVAECDEEAAGSVLETFFVELKGSENTQVRAMVDGVERGILIK